MPAEPWGGMKRLLQTQFSGLVGGNGAYRLGLNSVSWYLYANNVCCVRSLRHLVGSPGSSPPSSAITLISPLPSKGFSSSHQLKQRETIALSTRSHSPDFKRQKALAVTYAVLGLRKKEPGKSSLV